MFTLSTYRRRGKFYLVSYVVRYVTKNVRNLFETRDRAACSLFQLTEGEVNSIWFLMLLDMLQKMLEICSKQEIELRVHSFNLQKVR